MNDDNLDFLLDTMDTWSFSRLNSFSSGCKYEWFLHYIECNHSEQGAFSEFGSFIHKILEMYAKGELDIWDLTEYYEAHFDEAISHDFPNNKFVDLRESYYNKGYDYLENIDLILDNYEVLGVEKEIHFDIAGKHFVGYIDLLLKDKQTGEITILDHKSSTIKILKNGSVSKSDAEHFKSFVRQVCLYALPVISEYGRVDYFEWNMFKDRSHIKIPCTQNDIDEAVQWAKQTLDAIASEKKWEPNPDQFYCWNLCGQRNNACQYKP